MNFIKIYRIDEWYYYLGFIVLGMLFSSNFNISTLLTGACMLAYAFSYNDYWDKGLKQKYFLPPLLLSLIFLFFLDVTSIILSSSFLLIFTLYSGDPIRLKKIPLVGTSCNAIGFTLLFLLGYGIVDFVGLLLFFLLFCFNIVAQLIHEVTHLKQDKKDGFKTTAIFLGQKKIAKICNIFLLFAILISGCLLYLEAVKVLFLISTIIFCLFFIHRIMKGIDKELRNIYKYVGILLGFIYFLSILGCI